MNQRLEKLRTQRDRLFEKYTALGEKLKYLDEQIRKLEDTDIIGIVREYSVTTEELAELMNLFKEKPTSAMSAKLLREDEKKEDEE